MLTTNNGHLTIGISTDLILIANNILLSNTKQPVQNIESHEKYQYFHLFHAHIGGATLDMKERFLDEVKLHLQIGNHPNILSVLGCVTVDEPFCMVTEFMEFGDLLSFLRKCNTVSLFFSNVLIGRNKAFIMY